MCFGAATQQTLVLGIAKADKWGKSFSVPPEIPAGRARQRTQMSCPSGAPQRGQLEPFPDSPPPSPPASCRQQPGSAPACGASHGRALPCCLRRLTASPITGLLAACLPLRPKQAPSGREEPVRRCGGAVQSPGCVPCSSSLQDSALAEGGCYRRVTARISLALRLTHQLCCFDFSPGYGIPLGLVIRAALLGCFLPPACCTTPEEAQQRLSGHGGSRGNGGCGTSTQLCSHRFCQSFAAPTKPLSPLPGGLCLPRTIPCCSQGHFCPHGCPSALPGCCFQNLRKNYP